MLRCEKMKLVSVYLSKDTSRKTINELGNSEILHFNNLNNDIKNDKLLYASELRNIEKMQSRLSFLQNCISERKKSSIIHNSDIDEVEAEIDKFYKRMVQLKSIKKETRDKLTKLKEDLHMVEEMENLIGNVAEESHIIHLDFVTGIVDRDKKFLIKKVLHQALRRNLVLKVRDVEKDKKAVFIIFTHGQEALEKMKKIFVSLGGRVLDKEKYAEPSKGLLALTSVISQIENVEEHNREAMKKEDEKISDRYATWNHYVTKEFKIYTTLNKLNFNYDRDSLIGEAWVREDDLHKLKVMSESSENTDWHFALEMLDLKEKIDPPSSFKTNKYTEAFQSLTNVYGIPRYGEINPAIFTIFLFPMLFGVMFGDVLHGCILFGISIYFIKNHARLYQNVDSIRVLLDGRYIMILCSVASIFFGFLYSDFGSLSYRIFGSGIQEGNIYPFGIDPAWHHASNGMVFLNSIKMKLSIIIGFFHMGLGIVISVMNSFYFNDKLDLYCSIIPQAIGFLAFLGYLVFLIIYKWLFTFDHPSIISTLVAMYTSPFTIKDEMYPNQMYVQLLMLSLLLISIPWMFFSKPIILISRGTINKEDIVDIWMEQGIQSIEFGISLISNASSYLRLWAVSLAHAQLTSVLHNFTIKGQGIFGLLIFFPLYVILTMSLLIGLEGLGTCLHALRLNWIEFHSKFYKGDGYLFEPLSFKNMESE